MLDAKKREAFASLTSLFKPKTNQTKASLRPPYATKQESFETICLQCEEKPCISACEEDIIVLDAQNLPSLVFTKSGCTFCKKCALACPLGVLDEQADANIGASFKIDTQSCIAWKNVICNSCADVCDVKAIRFFGLLRPLLEASACTHCGFCYGVCPTNAIQYRID